MERFILPYEAGYLVYGNVHSGKTTIVKALLELLDPFGIQPRYIITTSMEDYEDELNEASVITDEYSRLSIDEWIENYNEPKIMVMDDFLHICTETGRTARHFKGLLSTTRKADKQMNIILSAHLLSIGKYIRSMVSCFIFLKIDEDAKKIIKWFLNKTSTEIEEMSRTLIENPYSFLIFNNTGEEAIMQLELED